jgi:hypothetical protein|uniref:Uncharacterized protein n=1 Tax=viral metagenome TaxID=1070528 RepID=A0A6C0B9J3_9ZZZZ
MHNYLVVSSIIGALYSILKYALTYKENPKPDVKESLMVFACTIAGLYIYDNYVDVVTKPKLFEIFTDQPSF